LQTKGNPEGATGKAEGESLGAVFVGFLFKRCEFIPRLQAPAKTEPACDLFRRRRFFRGCGREGDCSAEPICVVGDTTAVSRDSEGENRRRERNSHIAFSWMEGIGGYATK
jgi:hypothetical protein